MTAGKIEAPADWDTMRARFRWPRARRVNIAEQAVIARARALPGARALTWFDPGGGVRHCSYAELDRLSARLANALLAHGLRRGDRLAILLPQMLETAVAHIACYRIGLIAVPLTVLFGPDALSFRLADSGSRAVITDAGGLARLTPLRDALPDLALVLSVEAPGGGALGFWQELGRSADRVPTADTGPEDPAFISYTSGTTGPPKGALHGHRVLAGHLPGVQLPHGFLPQAGDCLWTPADWAWMGGLANVLLPGLALGVPVIAHRMTRFDPDRAFALMRELGVRNVFLPPTALKLMRQSGGKPAHGLRSVASGGEALGAELLDWGRSVFGTTINEFYGQTECNLVVGNCHQVLPVRPGAMGRAIPGHRVAVIGPDGQPLPPGETGEIAVARPDPVMFLGYWNQPERTAAKFAGDWMRTGDEGVMDEDGFFHFAARSDDVITSSGYRIGPSEIEDCLGGHPDVVMAGVVGVPDPVRTEAVRAFVVIRPDAGRDGLADRLIAHVRARLSPHLAPREVVFVDSLPMTSTGKILRRDLRGRA
jgi:acetyl-CoA synthetase